MTADCNHTEPAGLVGMLIIVMYVQNGRFIMVRMPQLSVRGMKDAVILWSWRLVQIIGMIHST